MRNCDAQFNFKKIKESKSLLYEADDKLKNKTINKLNLNIELLEST